MDNAWELDEKLVNAFYTMNSHQFNRHSYFRPLTVPEFLRQPLAHFNGDPAAWWSGQLITYLLRPRPELAANLKDFREELGFEHPIVGWVIPSFK